MRIAIASRIFDPEPSAASFRLGALAEACVAAGHATTVLTVRPPRRLSGESADARRPYRVRRFPVLRDRSGYVRGYVQYLSFDLPLLFRILFGPRRDAIVVEPPPTTGFFVRLAATLRRTPYVYYAADIWSDAASQTGAPGWMVRAVRGIERFALRGAAVVLSVSEGVTGRLAELGIAETVVTVGNGVDVGSFLAGLSEAPAARPVTPEFVYAGTASEWHGAEVFVRALPAVRDAVPGAVVRFIGGGSERASLEALATELGVGAAVRFEPAVSAPELAPVLRGATAALASVRPGSGYDFAFPTKLYSAAVCGAPLVYAGIGPAADFVRTEVDGRPIGVGVPLDAGAVAAAMIETASVPGPGDPAGDARRGAVSAWAGGAVGLDAVAARAVDEIARAATRR
ncbi:glycosyltransferase WbuB [Leucobacter zeae]|nr:glycosyltransferase WbuB [Leucobacter zeae]